MPRLIDKEIEENLEIFGLYFEALYKRDLKIYAENIVAKLYHYRKNDTGIKVDE